MRIKTILNILFFLGILATLNAQTVQPYIVVDQFGYRPTDVKTAVLADPLVGYNAADEFIPGSTYQIIKKSDNKVVFEGKPTDITEQWFRDIYGEDAREVEVH